MKEFLIDLSGTFFTFAYIVGRIVRVILLMGFCLLFIVYRSTLFYVLLLSGYSNLNPPGAKGAE